MVEAAVIIGGVTLIFTLYIAYKSKASSVESKRERQRYLTERCEGQKIIGDPTVIRIESVEFEGDKRGIRGWFAEEYPGESVVSLSFMNVFVVPSFLEQLGEEPQEYADDIVAEELGTKVVGDTTMTNWRVRTNDPEEIRNFVRGFANAIDSSLKDGAEYVQLTKKVNIN